MKSLMLSLTSLKGALRFNYSLALLETGSYICQSGVTGGDPAPPPKREAVSPVNLLRLVSLPGPAPVRLRVSFQKVP